MHPDPPRGGDVPDDFEDEQRWVDRQEGSDSPPGYFSGIELLRGRSARDVLKRLIQGDPLELGPRCRDRIEIEGLLLDPSRLHLRAVARVARAARTYHGESELNGWILGWIDVSIRELLEEDREEERAGVLTSRAQDPRYAFVAETLGIEAPLARRACIAFNRLPREVRSAYYAVLILGKTVNRYVAEGNGPPEMVKARIEVAVQAVSNAIGRPFGGRGESGDRRGGSP